MELANRYEIERKLARVLSKDLRIELDKLLNYLGDPPNLANVPAEYWQGGWKDIQKDVEPVLVDALLQQADDAMIRIGIGVDFDNVNRAAVNWARQHSEEVMQQIWLRTHEYTLDVLSRYSGVGEVIAQGYEEGLTIREISERLERMFSPVRAERIAVTETTRAVVEGERAYVAELERETGQRMIPIWMTANDELVCPICAPKNEKPITNGDYPPAHPNCRCGVGWEFPKDGAL
jgi:hypothetical protein